MDHGDGVIGSKIEPITPSPWSISFHNKDIIKWTRVPIENIYYALKEGLCMKLAICDDEKRIRDARLITYDYGHYIHYFKSEEMSKEIKDFIASLPFR